MTGRSQKKLLWLVHLLGLVGLAMGEPLFAQPDTTNRDSNLRLVVRLDLRQTRLDGQRGHIVGAMLGARFGQRGHQLMLGYHWLGYDAPNSYIVWRGGLPRRFDPDYFTLTDARFVSLGYWYPVFRNPKWYVAVPLEIGYGGETKSYRERVSPAGGTSRFQLAQVGAFGVYRFLPWLGVSTRVGYRQVLFDPGFSQRFSGVYYGIGVAVFPLPAYHALRDWRQKRLGEKGNQ